MSFIGNLKQTLNNSFNVSVTENGAIGFRTTGRELLDMNFSVSSMRNMEEREITDRFAKVFYEDRLLAVKWLFYAADVRGGMGERRLFRICFKYLAENHKELAERLIKLVPEYTRWDNLFVLLNTPLSADVISFIRQQFEKDIADMEEGKNISLLGKWMPSVNASSRETKSLAKIFVREFHMTEKEYRQSLARLRSYLKVVEVSMSRGAWSEISYEAVPSKANLIYAGAFLRNDEMRRHEYLESLKKGETTIHAGVLFPHDIVSKYFETVGLSRRLRGEDDDALEQLWRALPDYVQGDEKTICVADGSGSMTSRVGKTNITCLDVADALAIYFSERLEGPMKDTYLTFSMNPQFVDMKNGKSLREKLDIASRYNEVSNTNIEKVFDLILQTALDHHMSQKEMPDHILILSDMEFDVCAGCECEDRWRIEKPKKSLFEVIKKRYEANGYKLPRLVFWNICSRTGTIPVKENDLGVALVSGFSPSIVKMVLSSSTDPLECLLEQLQAQRYDAVEQALEGCAGLL